MKKIILILSAAVLLLCTTTCNSEETNKGRFAKNIPACIKQTIKDDILIIQVEEYCSTDGTKKIYTFLSFHSPGIIGYDENCNLLFIQTEEWRPLDPDGFVWGFLLPDGTIKYKYEEDIYHFKRIVFTQK